MTFEQLELSAALRRALADAGYSRPTPIQAQAIPAALQGRDILGKAQTGTGKTAAFSLPLLQRLEAAQTPAQPHRPVGLILAPTRELVLQIAESLATYGRHLRLRVTTVFGGVSQVHQVRALARGVHLVVATPGRLLDLLQQRHLTLEHLEYFVLDEADRMLDMGFLPDLRRIMARLPAQRQSLFFSATTPPAIVELTERLLRDPVRIDVAPQKITADQIDQRMVLVENRHKLELLHQLLDEDPERLTLVFTRTKHAANNLAKKLLAGGVSAAAIHGNKSQAARQAALAAFRRGEVNVLVATDIVARGIDIDDIGLVVNYDLPDEPESYVHRIGRTGRCGADGLAISFCSPDQRGTLRSIEKLLGRRVPTDVGRSSGSAPQRRERPDTASAPARDQAEERPRSRGARPPQAQSARRFGGRPGRGPANFRGGRRPRRRRAGSGQLVTSAGSAGRGRD